MAEKKTCALAGCGDAKRDGKPYCKSAPATHRLTVTKPNLDSAGAPKWLDRDGKPIANVKQTVADDLLVCEECGKVELDRCLAMRREAALTPLRP